MPAIQLSPAERRRLRADAHHLNPVVLIGSDGLTDAVRKEADAALTAHGLIKLRVFSDLREAREQILSALTDGLNAAAVQHIGKLLVLWRPIPEKAKEVPDDRQPGPRIVKLVSFSKSGNHRATVKKVKVLGNERVTRGGSIKRKEVRQVSQKKRAAG
jgi:putative YhbY family RNA-binding protein